MKKLLAILLCLPMISLGQSFNVSNLPIDLTEAELAKKYENCTFIEYFDKQGERLTNSDGETTSFNKIDYAVMFCFKGIHYASEALMLKYYSNKKGELLSLKSLSFIYPKNEGEIFGETYFGSSIYYWRNGRLKKFNKIEDEKLITKTCWDENGNEIECK